MAEDVSAPEVDTQRGASSHRSAAPRRRRRFQDQRDRWKRRRQIRRPAGLPARQSRSGRKLGKLAPGLVEIIDKPFLIWEYPSADAVWIDQGYQPQDSFVRVLVNDSFSHGTRAFVFYYFWQNPSPAPASVVFATTLVYNGECKVSAAHGGLFSGTSVDLFVSASLGITRYFGWGTDPKTGLSLDGTPVTDPTGSTGGGDVVHLHAQGGGIFGDPGTASQSLSLVRMDCGYRNLIVPGNASVLLASRTDISYQYDDGGGNLEDNVTVDFSNAGRFIGSPSMIVLATPP